MSNIRLNIPSLNITLRLTTSLAATGFCLRLLCVEKRQASPFRFLGKDEVISLFDHTDISEDEDEVHFNIYTVDSDYRPKKPGTDYMGILRHDHVTNESIEMYREEGTAFLSRRRIL